MERVGTDDEDLLGAWRRGSADRGDLYRTVRTPMYQRARQGIGSITSSDPHPQDVEDAVYNAFLELERRDPAEVVSIVGLAKMIAYRRGQDIGRKIIRVREQISVLMTDRAVTAELEFRDDEVLAAAEQEVLLGHALDCMGGLTEEQRDIVRATVMARESLSDWALRAGKTHQAASRQRARALESLRRCIESKGSPNDRRRQR